MSECLFCRIAQRELPADIVTEDRETVAFKDINPQAPTHVLIIPKTHVPRLSDLAPSTAPLVTNLVTTANAVAKEAGLTDYRLVINCGPQAGQSVFHLHVHLLGGRPMRWPPG